MVTLPNGFPLDLTGAFNMLKTRKRLSVDDLRVLAMIEAAGEEFYMRIAKGVRDPEAAALLTQNGREERGHAHRLLKAIVAEGGDAFELPEPKDNPFFASLPGEMPATAEFLTMLEGAEQDGDRVYQAWADATPNAEVAKILRQNGREESRHGERDAKVVQILARSN
jgi:rubrerythrin